MDVKPTLQHVHKVSNHILYTCYVEKDLDFLISGWSSDSSVPFGALVGLHAGVLWLLRKLSCARSKA